MSHEQSLKVAAVAALCLGGLVFAADAPPMLPGPEGKPTPNGMATEAGQGTMTNTGMPGSNMKMDMQSARAADAQLHDQLMMIAKSDEMKGDKLFVLNAACANMWEIKFSQLAEQKSTDKQVKELAHMVANDHEQALKKLMPVASKLGVTPPTELGSEKQAKLDVFSSMPADKFDAAYLSQMKVDHAEAITMFAGESKYAEDSAVKEYAADCLPHLKEHGQKIVEVATAKGMPGGLSMPDDAGAPPMPMK